MCLKRLCDELCDIGEKVSDDLLLSTLIVGLNKEFTHAAANLKLIPNPTFPKVVAYLCLEERRMKKMRARAVHTTLAAGTWRDTAPQQPSAPFPPQPVPPPFPHPQ